MMNPEKDKTMVQELLEFKDTIDSIIKQSFNKEDCVEVKKVRFHNGPFNDIFRVKQFLCNSDHHFKIELIIC